MIHGDKKNRTKNLGKNAGHITSNDIPSNQIKAENAEQGNHQLETGSVQKRWDFAQSKYSNSLNAETKPKSKKANRLDTCDASM